MRLVKLEEKYKTSLKQKDALQQLVKVTLPDHPVDQAMYDNDGQSTEDITITLKNVIKQFEEQKVTSEKREARLNETIEKLRNEAQENYKKQSELEMNLITKKQELESALDKNVCILAVY